MTELQEFNSLLVVVYATDKTAHAHTPLLPPLPPPLQSVGQGELHTLKGKAR